MTNKKNFRRHPIVAADMLSLSNTPCVPWEQLRGKTVLITGAAGFLATYMVEILLFLNETRGMGITVICMVRDVNHFNTRFAHHVPRQDLICLKQDISTAFDVDYKVDFIIHAASKASPKYYSTDPVGTLSANTMGTAHLLDLAKRQQVEGFLYISSGEVYGQASRVPTAETDYGAVDPLDVRACYAESKRMGENMCVCWHHQFKVPAKIVRPFHTYGPGMQLDDGRVFADFVADILHNRDIKMKSDGLAKRAFCYIADATAGFFTILLSGENGKAYNIGNPKGEISIRDLAQLLVGIFPEKNLKTIFTDRDSNDVYVPSQVQTICPNIDLANALGWSPETSLEQGFLNTVNSYQT